MTQELKKFNFFNDERKEGNKIAFLDILDNV